MRHVECLSSLPPCSCYRPSGIPELSQHRRSWPRPRRLRFPVCSGCPSERVSGCAVHCLVAVSGPLSKSDTTTRIWWSAATTNWVATRGQRSGRRWASPRRQQRMDCSVHCYRYPSTAPATAPKEPPITATTRIWSSARPMPSVILSVHSPESCPVWACCVSRRLHPLFPISSPDSMRCPGARRCRRYSIPRVSFPGCVKSAPGHCRPGVGCIHAPVGPLRPKNPRPRPSMRNGPAIS